MMKIGFSLKSPLVNSPSILLPLLHYRLNGASAGLARLCNAHERNGGAGDRVRFGSRELGLPATSLVLAILVVQFVAFFGALLLGRLASRIGARKTILGAIVVWGAVSMTGFVIPAGQLLPFLVLSIAIGFVLGGSQALSRSLYSTLVPRGREAEYFGLYQAAERGTSWFGTLTFGLVFQFTGSYRFSIVALLVFFVVGFLLLLRVDVARGIRDAGNVVPAVV
jgi:UMF1 family MFS transporter